MSIGKRYLIVENNHASLSAILEQLYVAVGPADFKVALNGGHAYLHIDHLHLSGKLPDMEITLLLNIHTPLSNGFEFLNNYKANQYFPKQRIRILVMKENLTPAEIEQLESFNIEFFTLDNLSSLFTKDSVPTAPVITENQEVYQHSAEVKKNNKRGFSPGRIRPR